MILRFLWTYFPAFARFWVRTMGARLGGNSFSSSGLPKSFDLFISILDKG